jgi:hypothetical protein
MRSHIRHETEANKAKNQCTTPLNFCQKKYFTEDAFEEKAVASTVNNKKSKKKVQGKKTDPSGASGVEPDKTKTKEDDKNQ